MFKNLQKIRKYLRRRLKQTQTLRGGRVKQELDQEHQRVMTKMRGRWNTVQEIQKSQIRRS